MPDISGSEVRMSELDALFEAEQSDEVEQLETDDETTAEQESTEEVEAEETDETGSTAEPDKQKPAKPADDDDESSSWTKVAYLDEKRKRQELERKLDELSKPKTEQEEPDIFQDPKAVLHNLEIKTKTNLSRSLMKEIKPDYDEKEKVFVELVNDDPSLIDKMVKAENPAKFAYETAVKHLAMKEIGDPVTYRERLKQEVLAELKAELGESPKKKAPSLTKTTSAGGTKSDAGDQSLDQILGR